MELVLWDQWAYLRLFRTYTTATRSANRREQCCSNGHSCSWTDSNSYQDWFLCFQWTSLLLYCIYQFICIGQNILGDPADGFWSIENYYTMTKLPPLSIHPTIHPSIHPSINPVYLLSLHVFCLCIFTMFFSLWQFGINFYGAQGCYYSWT